ncbi:MAG: hypothetical protein ACPG4T_15190 [Nannocystaceae bacterium]
MLEWTGNPFRGGRIMEASLGSIRAELCLIDPLEFCVVGTQPPRAVRRTWWLHLYPEPNYSWDGSPLESVMIFNEPPEAAKATASRLIEWAASYYAAGENDLLTPRRDAAGASDEE